jgi:hypothetical protein
MADIRLILNFPGESEKWMQWSKFGHATKLRPARFFCQSKLNIKSFHYINGKYVCSFIFEHLRKVCEPYIIFKETDVKLKRWSTFGLLRCGVLSCSIYRFRFPIHYPPPSNIFHPVLEF